MSENRKQVETTRHRAAHKVASHSHSGKNGYLNVVTPATASEIRRTLGITAAQMKNALRALKAAGIES